MYKLSILYTNGIAKNFTNVKKYLWLNTACLQLNFENQDVAFIPLYGVMAILVGTDSNLVEVSKIIQ